MAKLLYISDNLWRSNEVLQSWGLAAPFISTVLTQPNSRQEIVIELWEELTFEPSTGETAIHGPYRRRSLLVLTVA